MDLKSAYQQLPLDPESQQYVTINTHRGLYHYKRLPFGIASSPAIFQRTMDIILQGLDHVASIQDDILITGKDDEEHIANLNLVLKRLDDHGLRLQLNKCKFMQKSVTYMGCIISAEGISPTEDKVEAIKKAPRPENTTQLRAFLGMVNYHGKFIRNLSTILQPLNQLLQKNQEFAWSPKCEEAFNKAKESLTSSNVLVHYDPNPPSFCPPYSKIVNPSSPPEIPVVFFSDSFKLPFDCLTLSPNRVCPYKTDWVPLKGTRRAMSQIHFQP